MFGTHADLHDTLQQTWSRDAPTLPGRKRISVSCSSFAFGLLLLSDNSYRSPLRNPSDRPETFSMMSGQDLIHFLEGGPIKGQKLELRENEREEGILDMHAHLQAFSLILPSHTLHASCDSVN